MNDRTAEPTSRTNYTSNIPPPPEPEPPIADVDPQNPAACEDTIASLLAINLTDVKTFTNLCGLQQVSTKTDDTCDPTGINKAPDTSVTCLFNDRHCSGWVENGLCFVHTQFRLARPITEYDNSTFRITHASTCDIPNDKTVRIFPLLTFQKNLTAFDLHHLNHNNASVLNDSVNFLSGITKPLSNEDNLTEERTEYIKKVIQFRDSHRPHLMRLAPVLSNINVFLYFTRDYRGENKKVRDWLLQSQPVQNARVHRIKLLEMENIMDIYNILFYTPAKKISETGQEFAYIPDVIILDGYVCYGHGFGQTKLMTPDQAICPAGPYYIKPASYWEYARKVQTIRVAPLTLDCESNNDTPVLVVLDLKKQQTLSTKANILPISANYRNPAIEGALCLGN